MKKTSQLLAAAFVTLLAVSCAPQTPDYRISMRPAAFERLSEKNRELVRKGEIAKGMDREAVELAWGSPSGRVEGLRDGKPMERWDYQGTKPVVTNNFFGGYGYGAYGPYRYSGLGGGFGPQVSYLPYRKSSVWFIGGRVDAWERTR
ncbi:hypothetical protein HZ994_14305 [Akkermansiaceae bacterium]|nr:hypothetical protein HZ994_14305 [Akkermansiaceae bacterium]